MEATIREVREEVGLEVKLMRENQPDYVQDIIHKNHYIIITSAGTIVSDVVHSDKENIVSKWFTCARLNGEKISLNKKPNLELTI